MSIKQSMRLIMSRIDPATPHPILTPSGFKARRVVDAQVSALLADDRRFPEIEAALPEAGRQWVIHQNHARFLARLVVALQPRHVLEFGAGVSSLVLARALARIGGGQLTSIEQMPEWCAEIWAQVQQVEPVDSRLVVSSPRLRIGRDGVYFAYETARQAIADRGPYDLVLIDAPAWFYGRDGSLHLAYDYLKPNALIVLDDAARGGERWALSRWLRTYAGLQLAVFDPAFSGRGIAVLRHDGDKGSTSSLNSLITSACWALTCWPARYKHRRKRI